MLLTAIASLTFLTSESIAKFDPKALASEGYWRSEHYDIGEGDSETIEFRGRLTFVDASDDRFRIRRQERAIRHVLDGQDLPMTQNEKPAEWTEFWSSNGQADPLNPKEDLSIGRIRRIYGLYRLPSEIRGVEITNLARHESNLYPGASVRVECIATPRLHQRSYKVNFKEVGDSATITADGRLTVDIRSWAILEGSWTAQGVPMPGNPNLQAQVKIAIKQDPKAP